MYHFFVTLHQNNSSPLYNVQVNIWTVEVEQTVIDPPRSTLGIAPLTFAIAHSSSEGRGPANLIALMALRTEHEITSSLVLLTPVPNMGFHVQCHAHN
jgi:hypothetical protein